MAPVLIHTGLRDRVERALDRLRPALLVDGANAELIDVDEDGTAHIALQGACATSPALHAAARLALEAALREEVPDLTAVVSV